MKKEIKTVSLISVALILISIIILTNISTRNVMYILGDEFGYWTAAAYFSGYNWSNIAEMNSYFSFGYGLLLAPLFLINNSELIYKMAILYNLFFVLGSFLLAYQISKKVALKKNKYFLIIISFITILYPSNLAYAQMNISESLLTFLVWLLVFLLIKIEEKPTVLLSVLIAIVIIYLYYVHMRALSVLIATIIYFVYLKLTSKIQGKHLTSFFVILLVLFFVGYFIKGELTNEIYLNSTIAKYNDYGGQVGKIKSVFQEDGLRNLLFSLLGKIFYLGSATFLLYYYYIYFTMDKIKRKLTGLEEKTFKGTSVHFFLILIIIFSLGISAIYMIEGKRIDTLLYGRYNEYILGPIILFALYKLIENCNIKLYCLVLSVHLILGMLVANYIENSSLERLNTSNVMGIYRFMITSNSYNLKTNYILFVTAIVALLSFVIYFSLHFYVNSRNKILLITFLIIISSSWLYLYFGTDIYKMGFRENNQNYQYLEIRKEINKTIENQSEIYYLYDSEKDSTVTKVWVGRLQFLEPESKIKMLSYDNLEEVNKNGTLFISKIDSFAYNELIKEYEILEKDEDMVIFNIE